MRRVLRGGTRLAAGLVLLVAPAACGGASGYDGAVYRDEEVRFRLVRPPPAWRRVELADENDLAFHHEGYGALIQVNATCDPALDIPLLALTNQVLAGFTDREIQAREVVPFVEREALRTRLRARLDGVPRELLLVVAKKNGCVYDFALVTPPDPGFQAALPDFEALLASFATIEGPR